MPKQFGTITIMRMKIKLAFILSLIISNSVFAQAGGVNNASQRVVCGAQDQTCQLSTNTKGNLFITPDTTLATWVRSTTAGAAITASYVSVLTGAQNIKFCRFRNTTDAAVSVSFNGTTDDIPAVSATTGLDTVDFGSDFRSISLPIYIKYTTTAATTGSFYINCFY